MAAPQAEGVLPHARVRRIMKAEPALRAVTNEASLLVSKAAELFLESLAEQAAGGRASEVTYAAVGTRPERGEGCAEVRCLH